MPSREIVSPLSPITDVLRAGSSEYGDEISGNKTETTQHGANRPELTGHSTPYAMVSNMHHTSIQNHG
jgi:hypothetical protein